jgi:hypothetical protein
MEFNVLFQYSQQPITGPSEPDESNPHEYTLCTVTCISTYRRGLDWIY